MCRVRFLVPFLLLSCGVALLASAAPARALTPAGPGWFWQSPQPTGQTMAFITFADEQHAWGLGWNDESVLTSPDAGVSWQAVDAGLQTGEYPERLGFSDGSHGWVLVRCDSSRSYSVACTEDGGLSWERRPVAGGRSVSVSDVDFVDADTGWACGDDANGGFLLRTTDGGQSWRRTTRPTTSQIWQVDFVDAQHGWAIAAGSAFVTDDGGSTWHRKRLSPLRYFDAWDLQAVGPDAAYVLAFDWRWSTWTNSLFAVKRSAVGLESRLVLDAGAFGQIDGWDADEGHVWAVVNDWLSGEVGQCLARSDDSGETWSRTYLGGAGLWGLAANSAGVLVADSARSVDGGSTWQASSSGDALGLMAVDALAQGDVWAVGTHSPWGDQGGAYAGFGVVLHSPDGVHWQEPDIPLGPSLTAVSFADSSNGWAVGLKGRVLHTADGGATWEDRSVIGGDLRDVQFRSATLGWAVGAKAMRTTDGGTTWQTGTIPKGSNLTSACFVSDSHGWAVGWNEAECADGLVLETTDGGVTWQERQPSGDWWMGGSLHDVFFSDEQHGWMVGGAWHEDELLYRTVDGGATWELIEMPDGPGPAALYFTDEHNGLAVGSKLWRTTDGGVTWQSELEGFGVSSELTGLTAIDGRPDGNVWLVGLEGTIVSSMDTADDTAPPATLDDGDRRWHASPQTVTLHATDIGSAGVARTEYRVDGDAVWHEGDSLAFNAPRDGRGDGKHWITYRSIDTAGNVEHAQRCPVMIDTQGPEVWCAAQDNVTLGRTMTIRYDVRDMTPRASVRIVIYDYRTYGDSYRRHVERTIRVPLVTTGKDHVARFRCRMHRGTHWYDVYATDLAGNHEVWPAHDAFRVR